MSKAVGLFGGSFDPVHNAHVALAHSALEACALDHVRWIPAGQPWQKQRRISAPEHREAMVRLAIEGEPRFVLDRIELERPGPSYTITTVRALAAAQPDAGWVLILGWDQYAGLPTWHGWRELLQRVSLAVARRPGETRPLPAELEAEPHRALHLPLPPLQVSATDIRARAARGLDISHLVPPQVARYIELHRLYSGTLGS